MRFEKAIRYSISIISCLLYGLTPVVFHGVRRFPLGLGVRLEVQVHEAIRVTGWAGRSAIDEVVE